ncbi:Phospholipase D LcsSicTox-betaIC1, partial [Clarias magur]
MATHAYNEKPTWLALDPSSVTRRPLGWDVSSFQNLEKVRGDAQVAAAQTIWSSTDCLPWGRERLQSGISRQGRSIWPT